MSERMYTLSGKLKSFLKSEEGVTSVEYAIVAAGVVAVVSVIFAANGPVEVMLDGVFKSITTKIAEIIG